LTDAHRDAGKMHTLTKMRLFRWQLLRRERATKSDLKS